MSENQPSEHDRQQRLAELQERLQRLTEERKAELRQSGPLPGDVSPPSAEDEVPEQALDTPQPSVPPSSAAPPPEPQRSAPPPPDPLPVLETPPPLEAPVDQPVATAPTPSEPERPAWLKGMHPAKQTPAEATAAEPAEAEPYPAEPAPAAEPAAAAATPLASTRQPSAASAARSVPTTRFAVLAGAAKRAAQALGRQAKWTAKAKAPAGQRPARQTRAQPRPEAPAASEEPAERRAKKKPWLLFAPVLVGLGLSGGIALLQLGDFELSEVLDGALPAAETDDAESDRTNAAGSALPVEKDAGSVAGEPATSQLLVGGSAPDDTAGSGETASAEIWTAPPELKISSPDAPDLTGVEVDLSLLEPAASEPTPIGSSSSLQASGNPTQRPTFIPYDVPPKLENPSEIQRLLERGYPPQLRDAGIEGTVILWIFVDAQGAVQKMEIKESSGYELMDKAALSTAEKMRFAPAMNRDKATSVWLAQPITFR